MRRAAVALAVLAGLACKVEPVGEIESAPMPEPPESWFSTWEPAAIVDEEASLVEAELRAQMALLTNAALGGRRPGTEGAGLTASHLERTMLNIGLSPAGVGGGWRQPVVVRIRNTDDGQLELPSTEGNEGAEILRHGEDIILERSAAAGAWVEDLRLVDVGYGITAPEHTYNDYALTDVKGKVVVAKAGVPDDPRFSEAEAETYASLAGKLAAARNAGAAGCLVGTGLLVVDTRWADIVDDHRRPRVVASDRPDNDMLRPALVGLLSAEGEAAVRAWMQAAQARDDGPGSVKATVTTTERTVVDPNIVGRIPGRERPAEVIVVLAHWDAGGTGPMLPQGGGAIDNATGVAALLATARRSTDWVRRGRLPERSIAFVATASDTLDLAGTRALLGGGPLGRSDVVAVIALDALSVHPGGPALGALGLRKSTLGQRLIQLRGSIRAVDPSGGGPVTPSHEAALRVGIPAVTLTRHDAHTDAPDTYDPNGSVDDLREDVSLVFDLAWAYAESDERATVVTPDFGWPPPPVPDGGGEPEEPDQTPESPTPARAPASQKRSKQKTAPEELPSPAATEIEPSAELSATGVDQP